MLNCELPRPPCRQCGNNTYLAPYARTAEAVICSRKCWERYTANNEKREKAVPMDVVD